MPKRHLQTLTKTRIDSAPPGTFLWDAQVPGFGVRVLPSGRRSFVFQFRTRSGQQGRMQVGHYPAMTVEMARKVARGYLAEVDTGKNPSHDRKQARSAPKMADLAAYYCGEYARSRGLGKQTVKAAEGLLKKFVLPRLGTKKVAEFHIDDVRRVLGDATAASGKYSANKLRAVLSRMFTLACQMEWREANPCLAAERHKEEERNTFLSKDEVMRLLAACDAHSDQNSADAIRLLIFTGARLREVLKASWSQFDLDKAIWEKPSHHTKTKLRHQVFLADRVVVRLRQMRKRMPFGDLLFPGQSLQAPRTDLKRPWKVICERAGLAGYRIHDLRRTFATFMLSTGSDLSAVGKALGHTQASTTQRYASLMVDVQRNAANRAVNEIDGLRVVS